METNSVQTVTLTNSIIGVGILSMPFCFQKCGIVLSVVLLLLSSYVTRLVCSYMVKSAIISRRKNFEQIAFHAFGSGGKLLVELCVVGYLLGTCIAYFVVVGDLGPPITAKILAMNESSTLRTWVMIVVTIVCIIPLGMLRNVDSLASVCTASLGFYLCLVLKVISESSVKFEQSGWFERLDLWKWSGILQCLPIFTMALSCQMQIFEVYATMPTTSLDKMSRVIRQSTNICTVIYVAIGFFGYVAFNGHRFSGNILVDFSPSFASDIIKMGFVLSVAFSFPLAIFPCRVSLYSLLYKRASDAHMYIPESKFRPLTIAIVVVALIFGLLIPSIEVVIGLVGSTIGVAICIIIPAACYMTVCKTNITERQLAQVMIAFGFIIMVLGTYANLQAIDRAPERKYEATIAPTDFDKKAVNPEEQVLKAVEDFKPPPPAPPVLPVEAITEKVMPKIDVPTPEPPVGKPVVVEKVLPNVPRVDVVSEASNADTKIVKEAHEEPRVAINNEAILKEEHEIAVEEKENIAKEIKELKNAKKVLEAEVENIKEELVKKNKETEQLVLKKLDEIAEKIAEQSAAKPSREEEPAATKEEKQQLPPVGEVKTIKDPKVVLDDPIVKLLKTGGNKTVPKLADSNNDTNSTVYHDQPAILSNDVDRGLEGAGGGELPIEQNKDIADPNRLENKAQIMGGNPANDQDKTDSVNKQASHDLVDTLKIDTKAEEGAKEMNKPTASLPETKVQHQEKVEKPLPPLPVEVPADGKGEQQLKEDADMAAGKRDLLAMRLKREVNPGEDEHCQKKRNASVQTAGNVEGQHEVKGDALEKDGFR
ncbi:putative sodium-coupled neutral amino acid transporter 10 [Anopheles ziemanni]|uniref:putative sodium-coupled neutral amino acid transporter 10 n=1 Tax=Anopheles coustani TaxID=139045 RepID=UPI002658B4E3|nr:putative sodium-coupled neutral amino acid transporter 10 [Anopheles coustani]XP_058174547.1 putative sodium-coupled neutral amino acid transporter 10 [Anopheles ziemanni]